MTERPGGFERGKPFTPAKLKLKNYVDSLALLEGGDTPDLIRQGSLELWPGCVLVAAVVNPDPKFSPQVAELIAEGWVPVDEDIEPLFVLAVYDTEGNERESLAIDAWSGKVTATMEQSELFEAGEDAPDYMIESFFRRYFLDHGHMSSAE